MCKAGKTVLLGTETINTTGMKCYLDAVACCVIVTGVVGSYTKELSNYISYYCFRVILYDKIYSGLAFGFPELSIPARLHKVTK
jgi:hypothetical protein